MKISISWVFDHIDADWRKLDMARLAELFIQTTAEIDRVYKVEVDTTSLFCAQATLIPGRSDSVSFAGQRPDEEQIAIHIPELKKDFTLPKRSDAKVGGWYLVVSDASGARWATLADVGGSKDTFMPEISEKCPSSASPRATSGQEGRTGKKNSELKSVRAEVLEAHKYDYIFELDNKSINHRPDLWGHRGVAREMAAMLGLKLKPLESMLASLEIIPYEDSSKPTQDQPFAITIENSKKCSRFAAFSMRDVQNQPSDLGIALRLARLDARPIDAIVDATNYVMFDLGHPMHAFDAQKIGGQLIEVRDARKGEKIKLLDGEEYALSPDDLIIASDKMPLGLAGIMGGAASAVSAQTEELLLEAACFNAAMIRTTAERAKKRTEASTRFEKSLDPNNNVNALRRFAQILADLQVSHTVGKTITSLGNPAVSPVIEVEHAYIESRLGAQIEPANVVELLERVEFGVKQSLKTSVFAKATPDTSERTEEGQGIGELGYKITVPTFRATKDIQGKQDIVEEVGRLFGYQNITPVLPALQLAPSDVHSYNQLNTIKETCAFVCKMREVANYNFFDESFIQSIGYEPGETLAVRSPVSQNWQRLVTSLVPNMLKGIQENSADCDQLRFFEMARIYAPGKEITESKSLTGILFEKKKVFTFYDGKAVLSDLFERLNLPITWAKLDTPSNPWNIPFQTALIKHGDTVIGTAGMMPHNLLHKLSEGFAFVFELDADFLLAYRAPVQRFAALPKLQPIVRDISLLVPLAETTDAISHAIAQVDGRIHDVVLIDFLERKEWNDRRAETFRFVIREETKTLTKEEIDAIVQRVNDVVIARGATIR